MASAVPKQPCVVCYKNGGIATCGGCQRWFCGRHFFEHRRELAVRMDDIGQERDLLQQDLIEGSHAESLLSQIDEWEQKSIRNIQDAARTARNDVRRSTEYSKQQVQASLREITEQLQSTQESDNFTEIDLEKWTEELKQIRKLLEKPLTIEVSNNGSPEVLVHRINLTRSASVQDENQSFEDDDITATSNLQEPVQKYSSVEQQRPFDVRSCGLSFANLTIINHRKGHALKRLVKMFSNTSSVTQSKAEIDGYIRNQGRHFKLEILVNCYLTAWHTQKKAAEKDTILHQYLPTVKRYIISDQCHTKVVVGVQLFISGSFFNNTIDPPEEIMTFTLDFFLSQRCTTKAALLQWYNSEDVFGYIGFKQAQRLAKAFINLIREDETPSHPTLCQPSTEQTASGVRGNDHFVLQKRRSVIARPDLVNFFSTVPKEGEHVLNMFYQGTKKADKLIGVVRAYLQAWATATNQSHKDAILTTHVWTIREKIDTIMDEMYVMLALQLFLYNCIGEDLSQLFATLTQFFLDHQCVSKKTVFEWYDDSVAHSYYGFEEIHPYAQTFVEELKAQPQ